MSISSRAVVICVFMLTICASLSDHIFKIHMFEIGESWVNSGYILNEKLVNYLWDSANVYSTVFYIVLSVFILIVYQVYGLVFRPMDRIRNLGDLGYLPDGTFTKKEIANNVKKRRAVGDIPPVYPNGWFGIIESWRLKKGDTANISVLGKLSFFSIRDSWIGNCVDFYVCMFY